MTDFYLLDEKLTDEERGIRDRLREFCAAEITPVINGYWERAEFPFELVPKIAALQLAGGTVEGYGCPGMSWVAAGLVAQEWARSDGSVGTFFGVHSFLAMQTIGMLGSEEQKRRWLPPMARMEKIGAFALTEPDHGSDSVALETSARRDGDSYVINGAKKWIGNGTIADVVVVWARDVEDGQVKGFLVEKGTPGYHASKIEHKVPLRAVWQAEIALDEMRVPAENKLPGANTFKDTAKILVGTRLSCAWGALGSAVGGFDAALSYAKGRKQFGKPLAGHQIIQQRLVKMLADVTAMQLYCLQMTRLAEQNRLGDTLAGLGKFHNTTRARAVLAEARDLLGGNGILLDYQVIKHMVDLEAIHTFEGTETIQALIVGRDITGISAFA